MVFEVDTGIYRRLEHKLKLDHKFDEITYQREHKRFS